MSRRTGKGTCILVLLLLVCCLLAMVPAAANGTVMETFYVSPLGDDSNPGTENAPFQTLERAKSAVAEINGDMTGDIVVCLMDGVWELEDTLTFGQADSGTNGYFVRYEAAPGAAPLLSGGTRLTGTWTEGENGIWSIPLDRDVKLRALYVNGERRYMANTGSTVKAQGSWGTYVVGTVRDEDDYTWETIYSEDFNRQVAVGTAGALIQKYAKDGNTNNVVLHVTDGALQIAHTQNGDYGFEIPGVKYQNGRITCRVKFAGDHVFSQDHEALHMHGANKVIHDSGRTTWAGIKLAPHLGEIYFQYGTSGGIGNDEVTGKESTAPFTYEKDKWYQVKMLVTADGTYLTKIWKHGEPEPADWSRRESFSGLEDQDLFFRVYGYKNRTESRVNILVDDIVIQNGTLTGEADAGGLPDWAWNTGSGFDGLLFNQSGLNLSDDDPNVMDIEIENQRIWNKNIVCIREIEDDDNGKWILKLQQPYGVIAQSMGFGCEIETNGDYMIHNAFALLDQPGEFFFDRNARTLYYKPMDGEDLSTAEVFVPRLETIAEFKGTPVASGDLTTAGEKTITGQVKHIIFDGVSFAHTDWNLQKVGDSYGKATIQAANVIVAYSTKNWHVDMYRNLDLLPGAIEMEHAHSIKIRNGEIKLTGAEAVVLSNDVDYCEVSGNYFYQTGGSGVVVGHPTGIHENDSLEPDVYYYKYDGLKPYVSADGPGAERERWLNGTERVPRHVTVSDNLLVETCRLFPAHCPITSYFTQNLEVSSNFIYDASYSGMSIGWGWCNFDGETDGSNWGTDNFQGYSILPDLPTTVCFGNRIVNNRIDTTMTILKDGGLIYTLGRMPDTVISGNYGIHSERGIYQDEGSALIHIKNNVSADNSLYTYYAGRYGRKHDLTYTDNYADANKTEFAADLNVTSENLQIISDRVWPKGAGDIIQKSGLTQSGRIRYAHWLEKIYGSVQDALLPADMELKTGENLMLYSWLDEDDEIWLAPAGTTVFAEGPTMTKAAGNAEQIRRPDAPGTYYLYVRRNGQLSGPSACMVRVVGSPCSVSVSPAGGVYDRPQTVTLSVDGGSASLYYTTDGSDPMEKGLLYAAPISIRETTTLRVALVIGGVVYDTLTQRYLFLQDEELPPDPLLHLNAEELAAEPGAPVYRWPSETGDFVAVQNNGAASPTLALWEGNRVVRFDGDDALKVDDFVSFENKSEMTVVAVSRAEQAGAGGDYWCNRQSLLSTDGESLGYGAFFFGSYQEDVRARIGIGTGTNFESFVIRANRPEPVTGLTSTVFVKDGVTQSIYTDGKLLISADNGRPSITGVDTGAILIGCGITGFVGDIAELLIYDRALSEKELFLLDLYLQAKYFGNALSEDAIHLTDSAGEALDAIETGSFTATVRAPEGMAHGLLAAYDENGRMLWSSAPSEKWGRVCRFAVNNASGRIAALRFFALDDACVPLRDALRYPERITLHYPQNLVQ